MMKDFRVAQEFFELTKNYWIMTTEMLISFQEQNEKMWNALVEQGCISRDEAKEMLEKWLSWSKEQREQFNKLMEDNWKKAENLFNNNKK
jgi:polyhydroxyalkanoate synthesis regulator phasin